jgi:hypothetical protein
MSQYGNGNSSGVKHRVIRVGVIGYGYWGPNVVRNLLAWKTSVNALRHESGALARAKKAIPRSK